MRGGPSFQQEVKMQLYSYTCVLKKTKVMYPHVQKGGGKRKRMTRGSWPKFVCLHFQSVEADRFWDGNWKLCWQFSHMEFATPALKIIGESAYAAERLERPEVVQREAEMLLQLTTSMLYSHTRSRAHLRRCVQWSYTMWRMILLLFTMGTKTYTLYNTGWEEEHGIM